MCNKIPGVEETEKLKVETLRLCTLVLYIMPSGCVMARSNAAQLAPPAHCAVCKPDCKSPSISRLIAIVCVTRPRGEE